MVKHYVRQSSLSRKLETVIMMLQSPTMSLSFRQNQFCIFVVTKSSRFKVDNICK